MNFSLDNLKHVYVSSCRRGFLVVSDQPMCVTSEDGASGNSTIISVKRVYRQDGQWHYANPDQPGSWWLRKAWDQAVALTGAEPWRIYRLDAAEVAEMLDEGVYTDDIRSFENRCEPWQPISVGSEGEQTGHVPALEAKVWERTDGWRVLRNGDGFWVFDGSKCNADKSTLKYSPYHFDPLPRLHIAMAAEAMLVVDANRPWN